MFKFMWTALLPESEIDCIRRTLAAEFRREYDSDWHEEEIRYDVKNFENYNADGIADPIIRATFSFNAVCDMDLADAAGMAHGLKKLLRERFGIDDTCYSYTESRSDVSKWRSSVY